MSEKTVVDTPTVEEEEMKRQTFLGFKLKTAPPNAAGGRVVPENGANIFSKITFQWIQPLLMVSLPHPSSWL